MPNDSNYEYYVVDSSQSRYATSLRNAHTTSHTLSFYTGYYAGGVPVVLLPQPFDVAQDLSTGNIWQYTGSAWVAPSWNSAITFYLGAATTVCDRINSQDTKIPESIQIYTGTDSEVPADLALSENDLAIKHNLANYSIQVGVFRRDSTTDTVVEVPFPEGYTISTADGNWTILKNFNDYAGFDFCTIALTWTTNINGAGQHLEFITSSEAEVLIEDTLTSGGYATSDYVDEAIASAGAQGAVDIVDSTSTSAYIPVLSGGYYYTYTQPISALRIDSVTNVPNPAVINFMPNETITSVTLTYNVAPIWNEDWTEIVGTETKDITLLPNGSGAYVFAPGDDYEWYNVPGDVGQASGWLSGGSIVCSNVSGTWVVSASNVTEIMWHEGNVEDTRVLDGIIASAVDAPELSWVITDNVHIYARSYTNEMGWQDVDDRAAAVTANRLFDLNIPASVNYLNTDSLVPKNGQETRYTFLQGAAAVQTIVSSGGSYTQPYESAINMLSGAAVLKDQPFSTVIVSGDEYQDMSNSATLTFTPSGYGVTVRGTDYYGTQGAFADVSVDGGTIECVTSRWGADDETDGAVSVVIDNLQGVSIDGVDYRSHYETTSADWLGDEEPPDGSERYDLSQFTNKNVYIYCFAELTFLQLPQPLRGACISVEFSLAEGYRLDFPALSFYGVYPDTVGTRYLITITAYCIICVEQVSE